MTGRPVYLGSEQQDDLTKICLRLLGEVWALRDRLTIVETLLAERVGIPRDAIETYLPAAALAAELSTERLALIKRVMDAPFDSEPLVGADRSPAAKL